jgi:DNA-binding HxlR family transcriptional regulator
MMDRHRKKIGGKWKPMIMFMLYAKPERFNKIKQLLKTISSNQLSKCLCEMEKDHLVIRQSCKRYGLTNQATRISELLFQIKTIVDSLPPRH